MKRDRQYARYIAHVVDSCFALQPAQYNRLEEIQRARGVDLEGVVRCGKRLTNVGLRSQVIDLVRLDVAENLHQDIGVGDVAFVDGDLGLDGSSDIQLPNI